MSSKVAESPRDPIVEAGYGTTWVLCVCLHLGLRREAPGVVIRSVQPES